MEQQGPNTRKRLALVVDDEAGVRAFVAAVLRRCGYETVEADDGSEALDLVRALSASIALIVSDIRMPRMNGGVLARSVRKEYPAIPVLLMSGFAETPPPGFAFIAKPFTLEELSNVVSTVAANAEAARIG